MPGSLWQVRDAPELAGRNAAVVKRGAAALGWHGD
jgi:hypothetical protein